MANLKQQILLAIRDIGPETSSVEIRLHLGGKVSIGRLFADLNTLEAAGDIRSEERPGGEERNHHPKRVFWLTARGAAKARD